MGGRGISMTQQKNIQFLIIAYDIASNRRRNRLVKLLKGYGRRANYSVFECRVRKTEIRQLQEAIADIINSREDSVLYYPLCRSCVGKRAVDGFRKTTKKNSNQLII